MQYLYHKEAGKSSLLLTGDDHRYIFKVRRHREGEVIALRNLEDECIYFYTITLLDKREANLLLESFRSLIIKAERDLHIAWCVIDPKSVERLLPTLNEMGVAKITFVYCQRSQKSFKPDFKRMEKILLNSSQQCGRSRLMVLEGCDSLENFLLKHPESLMLNFSENSLVKSTEVACMVIGSEGGFTDDEVALFNAKSIIGLDTPLILKSESAACAVAAKLLL